MIALKKRILSLETLEKLCNEYRLHGKAIVLTSGAFDIIQPGHLFYLEKARMFGDVLIVGINTDRIVRLVKGGDRPINPQNNRAIVVAGFQCVEHVFIYEDNILLAKTVKPSIRVYSETSEKKISERGEELAVIEKYGGKVICLSEQFPLHTSDIIRAMKV